MLNFILQGNSTLLFKKKIRNTKEDDDYEYIGNENDTKLKENDTAGTSNKNHNASTGLTTKDKEVRYL